jgi:RNase H-fold protein (predicted Holliday junction resolvase)
MSILWNSIGHTPGTGKKRKKTLDTLSAVLILQGYLDSLK